VDAAWKQLPSRQRFPCDSKHLEVIRDYPAFLQKHPDFGKTDALREKGRQAIAFSAGDWPVYINLDGHEALFNRFQMGESWIAYPVAGVLAHERIHALGNLSESAGLHEELLLDQRFRREGKLPESFDLDRLEQQYLEAVARERKRPTGNAIPSHQ
jgi:hypothetical protein